MEQVNLGRCISEIVMIIPLHYELLLVHQIFQHFDDNASATDVYKRQRLGIEHADAIHFLDGEVDVLEDALALPSRAECLDTDGHAHADG